ncbi:hypothetical protein H8B02_43635 [Bradyrhizobium sp. Pear77]|uniref:hypothetical protein n=1 Tax=Bradyrhizobium altum TaxID=1571202 RepID=UPI001E51331A|nr:hypothetical protein [Bradyrhizobium altum]MCC8960056.1 hypothetical protein [Bradyrhizobium altum]
MDADRRRDESGDRAVSEWSSAAIVPSTVNSSVTDTVMKVESCSAPYQRQVRKSS